uniref:Uncharacterized protein n=1 Tax=Burkholderia sp. M701 TaxID=326454 RepID=V5YPP2_9BURK|nr:unnamed protein product [Burkholderia sp. M701]
MSVEDRCEIKFTHIPRFNALAVETALWLAVAIVIEHQANHPGARLRHDHRVLPGPLAAVRSHTDEITASQSRHFYGFRSVWLNCPAVFGCSYWYSGIASNSACDMLVWTMRTSASAVSSPASA